MVLNAMFLVQISHTSHVQRMTRRAVRHRTRQISTTLRAFRRIHNRRLARAHFSTPSNRTFSFIVIRMLTRTQFRRRLKQNMRHRNRPFRLIVSLIMERTITFHKRHQTSNLQTRAFERTTSHVRVMVIASVTTTTHSNSLVRSARRVRIRRIRRAFNITFFQIRLQPSTMNLLYITRRRVSVNKGPRLPKPFVTFITMNRFRLILRVTRAVIRQNNKRRGRLYERTKVSSLIRRLLMSIFFIINLNNTIYTVTRIIQLVSSSRVVITPISPFG